MKKLLIGRKPAYKPIENIFRGIAHMVFTMFFHSFLQFPSGSIFETTKWAQSTNKRGFEEDSKIRFQYASYQRDSQMTQRYVAGRT